LINIAVGSKNIKGINVKIRRFVAKDMRTALAQIKEELGADAVIMSNKKIPEGVELMAAIDYNQSVPAAKNKPASQPNTRDNTSDDDDIPDDVVSISQSVAKTTSAQRAQHNNIKNPLETAALQNANTNNDSLAALLNRKIQVTNSASSATNESVQVNQSSNQHNASQHNTYREESISEQLKSFTERLQQSAPIQPPTMDELSDDDEFLSGQMQKPVKSSASQTINQQQNEIHQLKDEMASIRQLLEHQVSGLMWQELAQRDPMRAMLVDKLTQMGLTEQIADQFAGYIPNNLNEHDAWQAVLDLLTQQLNTTNNDIIHRGGVVALVGPTGVGKTTTIAKLAARFAQIHGADSVALISTDTFRIAGFEQLATYGRIIGCQVKLAKDSEALATYLQHFSDKKLVLIDTAGMGQRDLRLVEHLSNLISNSRIRIRNYLVLAANTQQRVMQENVERFKKIPLAGCIYTKLDESLSVGEIIACSIQNGLPIGYLTDGQRVPEDIKVANPKKLVMLANKMTAHSLTNVMNWQSNKSTPLANVVQ
jgi:flagellar biosynthesis protein FlhF